MAEVSFKNLNELYEHATNKKLDFNALINLMMKHFNVDAQCAEAIWYVSFRSRGTGDHIQRLVKASAIKDPCFDWSSVKRGEEYDELKKHGLYTDDEIKELEEQKKMRFEEIKATAEKSSN